MEHNIKINAVAIIPARIGSKRIPKKNLKYFFGKPLIAYSIELALQSKLFKKVIVTTDDEETAAVARKYGAEIPFIRPKELSCDVTSIEDVINHALEYFESKEIEFDYCCTIFATAPLLQMKYLQEGYKKIMTNDVSNVFSATSMPFPIQRSFKVNSDNRCEMFTPEFYYNRSQDLEKSYQDAGQFYWKNLKIKSSEILFAKDSSIVIIPMYLVQDIDNMEDFERLEYMYKIINKKI